MTEAHDWVIDDEVMDSRLWPWLCTKCGRRLRTETDSPPSDFWFQYVHDEGGGNPRTEGCAEEQVIRIMGA